MLKLSDNPLMKPAAVGSICDLPGAWWVAHTKARSEKAFAWDMVAAGIGYFLPMIRRVTFSGGRKRHGMQPLFPGYVFLNGDDGVRYRALTTNRLCQVIPVRDRQKMVDELVSIEQALDSGLTIELYPFAAIGKRCRVAKGPLMGVIGTVVRRDNATRFVLQVSVLGNGASLEIDADLLEPAE